MSDKPTTERLAEAMEAAGLVPPVMIKRARDGYYDDYKSDLVFPQRALVADLLRCGALHLAAQAAGGEFDATKEEREAWGQTEEGRIAREMFGDLAKQLLRPPSRVKPT